MRVVEVVIPIVVVEVHSHSYTIPVHMLKAALPFRTLVPIALGTGEQGYMNLSLVEPDSHPLQRLLSHMALVPHCHQVRRQVGGANKCAID